ncbi:ubiquitin carboxyl-terminal hydrolase 15-like [Asparagus officinalis]|uniref:ubiquitin carboxyl-terminal hydrolase 15-like n=1 Tax=Asparagus officinalis TaxID=4686 RepID=UPI00098E3372|nr:ubiquitin carboxyl-terminal hydrolase 15-like [Asparagus officinalis]
MYKDMDNAKTGQSSGSSTTDADASEYMDLEELPYGGDNVNSDQRTEETPGAEPTTQGEELRRSSRVPKLNPREAFNGVVLAQSPSDVEGFIEISCTDSFFLAPIGPIHSFFLPAFHVSKSDFLSFFVLHLQLSLRQCPDILNNTNGRKNIDIHILIPTTYANGGSLEDVPSSETSKKLWYWGSAELDSLCNSCFINIAISLAHTPRLISYFLNDYHRDSMIGNGELALAFAELQRKLWVSAPREDVRRLLDIKLARFAQHSGFSLQDSQDILRFLLDGLHENLNCARVKKDITVRDLCNSAQHDSIIVDIFQGGGASRQ